jgi:hypothetical protein
LLETPRLPNPEDNTLQSCHQVQFTSLEKQRLLLKVVWKAKLEGLHQSILICSPCGFLFSYNPKLFSAVLGTFKIHKSQKKKSPLILVYC